MATRNVIGWGLVIIIILLGIFVIGLAIESAILEKSLKTLKRQESEHVKQKSSDLRQALSREFKERYKDFISSFEKRAEELMAEKKIVKELESIAKDK